MKQSLQLRMSQHLALTPQLQQSIRLLQLSTVELNQELEVILQANPLLERVDAVGESGESYIPEARGEAVATPEAPAPQQEEPAQQDFSSDEMDFANGTRWEKTGSGSDDDDNDYVFQESEAPTLREHLLSQLSLMPLSERDQTLAALLVDAINEGLLALLRRNWRWCSGQWVLDAASLRKRNHIAQRRRTSEQHTNAIPAKSDTAMRWWTELEGV